jgi:acetyltransferase-like isoleucine patch superfamily enzyme
VRLRSFSDALASLGVELRRLAGERRLIDRLMSQYEGLRLGPYVEIRSPERLHLGKRVTIENGVLLHCGGMEWSREHGRISIGDDTYVGPKAVLFGAGGIDIGSQVLISPGVVITSHQHSFRDAGRPMRGQPMEFAAVVIEDNVWIGSNATVLPGVRIGSGSAVGAGAVVTRSVPRRVLSLGVPARVVREL